MDIDKLLRSVADREKDPLPGPDEAIWAEVLRRAAVRRKRPPAMRRGLALAAGLCLVVLCLAIWNNVGTEDFALSPAGTGLGGALKFKSGYSDNSFNYVRGDSDTLTDAQIKELGEEVRSRESGGDRKLVRISGTTIGSDTVLRAIAEFETRFGPRMVGVEAPIPFNTRPTEASLQTQNRFMRAHFAEAIKAIKSGGAERLDPRDCTIEGRRFRLNRWRLSYPEFGTVIYWDGAPLP